MWQLEGLLLPWSATLPAFITSFCGTGLDSEDASLPKGKDPPSLPLTILSFDLPLCLLYFLMVKKKKKKGFKALSWIELWPNSEAQSFCRQTKSNASLKRVGHSRLWSTALSYNGPYHKFLRKIWGMMLKEWGIFFSHEWIYKNTYDHITAIAQCNPFLIKKHL